MLRIKLTIQDCRVYMQVLHQSNNITRGCGEVFSSNGMSIRSSNYPELKKNCILVRGSLSMLDNNVCSYECASIENAKEYFNQIQELVANYNKSCKHDYMDPATGFVDEFRVVGSEEILLISLRRIDSIVIAKVISQSDYYIRRGSGILHKSAQFQLSSFKRPQLTGKSISCGGSSIEEDSRAVGIDLQDPSKAIEYMDKIEFIITEFVNTISDTLDTSTNFLLSTENTEDCISAIVG